MAKSKPLSYFNVFRFIYREGGKRKIMDIDVSGDNDKDRQERADAAEQVMRVMRLKPGIEYSAAVFRNAEINRIKGEL